MASRSTVVLLGDQPLADVLEQLRLSPHHLPCSVSVSASGPWFFLTESHFRDIFGDRLKLNVIKIERNNQERDDNPGNSKGEHVAHVLPCDAASSFRRSFNRRGIFLVGHNLNFTDIHIDVPTPARGLYHLLT